MDILLGKDKSAGKVVIENIGTGLGHAQTVEHEPRKHEALNSIPSNRRGKKQSKEKTMVLGQAWCHTTAVPVLRTLRQEDREIEAAETTKNVFYL